jgi:hypothetical protein
LIFPFSQRAKLGRSNNKPWQRFDRDFTLAEWPEERLPAATPADTLDKVAIYAGLDLGMLSDPAALAVVRRHEYDERFVGPRWPYLELCRLHTWPPGTTRYEDIVYQSLMLRPDVIVYDYNGVGGNSPFMFREIARRLDPPFAGKVVPVQTVGSLQRAMELAISPEGRYLKITKRDLVSGLNILAQTRIVHGCKHCNDVRVGEEAVVRLGEHAGKTCKVAGTKDGGWIISIEGVKGKRLCGVNELYRSKPQQICPQCAYLRFCLPDEMEGKRLLQEMASFLERHGGGRTTYEHRTKTGHGDRCIAMALAVVTLAQGRRELVMI